MKRCRLVVLGAMVIGFAITASSPGPVVAQEVKESLATLGEEIRQLALSVRGARQDLLVVQRTQAQTRATVEELHTAVQMVDAKLDEFNHRLRLLAQRLDALQVSVAQGKVLTASAAPPPAPALPPPTPAEPEPEKPPLPTTASPPPAPGSAGPEEIVEVALLDPSEVFRAAHEDYVEGNYDLAILGFRDYLKKYPGTDLASSAQYWLGECYLGQKAHDKAVEEFQWLLDNYPDSPKVPAALYKQGVAYLELKEAYKARTAFETVVSQYPSTAEAQHAAERLKAFSERQ